MKRFFAVILLFVMPSAILAGDVGYKATYDGGSIAGVKAGSHIKMYFDSEQVRFMKGKELLATVPGSAITEVSYGQDVHRRIGTAIGIGLISFGAGALLALSKSKKHYVGLTWANGKHKGGLALRCSKNDYRGVLAALEGISGKKAVDSDTMTVK